MNVHVESTGHQHGVSVAGTNERRLSPAQGWFLVVVLFCAYTMCQIDRSIVSLLSEPIKRDLHYTDEQIGLLMGFGFSLTYALSTVFMAYLGDRLGRKRVLASGLTIWSLLTMLCAFLVSFPAMIAARLGVGVAESVMQPSAMPMVACAFPPEKRSLPLSCCLAAPTFGLIIAPMLIGSIVQATEGQIIGPLPMIGTIFGWQLAFLAAGAMGILVLPFFLLVREPENITGGVNALRIADSFRYFAGNLRAYAGMLLAVPVFGIAFLGVVGWMPSYLIRTFELNQGRAGLLLGLAWVPVLFLSPLGTTILGNWAARSSNPKAGLLALAVLIPLGALAALTVPLMPTAETCIVAYSFAMIVMTIAISFGAMTTQLFVPPQARSQAMAMFAANVTLIGYGLGPLLVGTLTTRVLGSDMLGPAMMITVVGSAAFAMAIQLWALTGKQPATVV